MRKDWMIEYEKWRENDLMVYGKDSWCLCGLEDILTHDDREFTIIHEQLFANKYIL